MCGIQRKTDTKRIPGYERPAEKYDCEKIMMFIRSIMMGRDDAQCFVKLVLMMILLFIVVTTKMMGLLVGIILVMILMIILILMI